MREWIDAHRMLFGFLVGVGYGLIINIAARLGLLKDVMLIMGTGFVFVLPFVLGFITTFIGGKDRGFGYYVFAPHGTNLACLVAAMVIGWEGLICAVLALPIYLLMGSLGGTLAFFVVRIRGGAYVLPVMVLLPPLGSVVDQKVAPPRILHRVHTEIAINATPEAVWEKIARVEPITEPVTGFFYRMGFPKPIEATLSHEGEGGVRHARFEKDLVFIETVDVWKKPEVLSFAIAVDPTKTPLTTLDPHVTVGSDYFDVMRGTYRVEKTAEGVILHLDSEFRLSTHFNLYAGLWGDFLMRDIQNSILQVIRSRSEAI